jgi:hypothetical protein
VLGVQAFINLPVKGSAVRNSSLRKLWNLYANPNLQPDIDNHANTTMTLGFGAAPGNLNYPRAKILDMVLYVEGGGPT